MKNLIAFFFALFLLSCGSEESKTPTDVSYEIIDEDTSEDFSKSNINIRLNKRVNEEVLTEIAKELKKTRTEYSKIWIMYLLPNMEVGKGAWATTNFTPDLEVEILGGTIEEIHKMESKKVSGEILGKWRDFNPLSESNRFLVKEEGLFKMKIISHKDGWDEVQILREINQNGKIKYEYENDFSEYYLLEENGNMAIFSENGKIKELMKLE